MHFFTFRNKEFSLERYPRTANKSLQPLSNAELLVLKHIEQKPSTAYHLFHDRFGVWNCALHDEQVTTVWNYASQKKSIQQNLERNGSILELSKLKTPLEKLDKVGLALMKVPKSLELFELYLQQIHRSSSEHTEVVCGFMTKYFSKSLITIASKYFEEVSQSLAWKKARLLILKSPKQIKAYNKPIHSIEWKKSSLKQYFGVFSSGKIDIGTQFLLENIAIKDDEMEVLDLASGNGIIALEVSKLNPNANLTLVDDSILAIESSKLNVHEAKFVCDDQLSQLPNDHFDLVLSNPPFHFEHENNIEVSLNLFKQVRACLKPNGRFVLVANKHLNYATQLRKLFHQTSVLKSNDKFEVLECLS
jgi:16S rRNA G1207 methylase RsmC